MNYPLFAVAVLAIGALLFARAFDKDAGGYRDGFFTKAMMPDKVVHFLLGALLFMALAHHMAFPLAFVGVCVIGIAYEVGQEYISVYDWLADIAGAMVAYLYLTFL